MAVSRLPVFTERFNKLRGDMTLDQFASRIGISRNTVGLYASGARIPDAVILSQIAAACDVSADYLLGLTDVMTTATDVRSVCDYTGLSADTVKHLACMRQVGRADWLQYYDRFIYDFAFEYPYLLGEIERSMKQAQSGIDGADRLSHKLYREAENSINAALYAFHRFCESVPGKVLDTDPQKFLDGFWSAVVDKDEMFKETLDVDS